MSTSRSGCVPCPTGTRGDTRDPRTGLRMCSACPRGTLQWRTNQSECIECPAEGIDCANQSSLVVLEGYYRPDDTHPAAIRCPLPTGCRGGPTPAQSSCAVGYTTALCGQCSIGFYRVGGGCRLCSSLGSASYTLPLMLLVLGVCGVSAYFYSQVQTPSLGDVAAQLTYQQEDSHMSVLGASSRRSLQPCAKSSSCAHRVRTAWTELRGVAMKWHLPPSASRQASTLTKILLGYCQVRERSNSSAVERRHDRRNRRFDRSHCHVLPRSSASSFHLSRCNGLH
jgi:hypothetical protein